jgi:osmoprotectant transport system ATP-binding protein
VEDNVAVVPDLLGWPKARARARVVELLDLVHLPPGEYARRYPAQLSGGQQQRVGLARALAADPEVLLMDEPFGAIDAITRTSLQDEVLRLQGALRKTVLFVTHDVDEALRLADRIAVLRDGRLVQYGTPCALLNHPADDFVAALLGADDRLRGLTLLRAEQFARPGEPAADVDTTTAPEIPSGASLREAVSRFLTPGVAQLRVVAVDGQTLGWLGWEEIRAAACSGGEEGSQ